MSRGRTIWQKVVKEWFWRADDVLTYRVRYEGGRYLCTLTRQCASPAVTENLQTAGSLEYAKDLCHNHYQKNYVPT